MIWFATDMVCTAKPTRERGHLPLCSDADVHDGAVRHDGSANDRVRGEPVAVDRPGPERARLQYPELSPEQPCRQRSASRVAGSLAPLDRQLDLPEKLESTN